MFTRQTRHTSHRANSRTVLTSLAAVGAIGLVGGLLVAAPAAAASPQATATWAQGQFLSGSIAGLDLDKIAQLTPATARNNGNQNTQEVIDPLAVSLLGTTPLNVGSVRVSPDAILSTTTTGGVLSQYAKAEKSGNALGASGTVSSGGAIGPNASTPGQALTLSLDALLRAGYVDVLHDLKLHIQAVAAQATGSTTALRGDYHLDGLTLSFTSPAVASLAAHVTSTVSSAEQKVSALSGRNGELAAAVNAYLVAVNPAFALGSGANVSVSLQHDLQTAVASLLQRDWGTGGVSFNLTSGKVSLDLATLVGGNLNNLPVGTELLSPAVITSISSNIAGQIETIAGHVQTQLNAALRTLKLDVTVELSVLSDQAPAISEICRYEDSSGNLLGDLVGSLLGKLVCTTTTTVLPKLQTSVHVDVHGTVAQVVGGSAPVTLSAKALGIPVTLSTAHVLKGLGSVLENRVLGSSGIVGTVIAPLGSKFTTLAASALTGSAGMTSALSGLLSLRVNLQETSLSGSGLSIATNTVFTQTALRVSVARGAGDPGLTTLNVAAASVAPFVTSGTPGGGGPGGDPDGNPDGNPDGDPGDPQLSSAALTAGPGSLAFTGVSIGIAIAILLALLTVGAWLAREGYKRNHPPLEL